MSRSAIIISASDANFFPLLEGLVRSIRAKPKGASHPLGVLDVGLDSQQKSWLSEQKVMIVEPQWEFDFPNRDEAPSHYRALLARPFLSNYFPDYDYYLWIDADAWIQNWTSVELLFQGAARKGFVLVPEIDRAIDYQYGNLQGHLSWIRERLEPVYGAEETAKLLEFPVLNAGVFAYRHDAPHRKVWAECIREALHCGCTLMTDQFALTQMMYQRGMLAQTELLPSWCNWVCHLRLPDWNPASEQFVEPYLPHTPLGIVHLTARKHDIVLLSTIRNETIRIRLRYDPDRTSPQVDAPESPLVRRGPLPAGDYISPGFQAILPDAAFPHLTKWEPNNYPWPYLRSHIPHANYADRRYPGVGFCNRDEASILYNTALQFQHRPALEIGCWLGWSAAHLTLGGVWLDVVDPILARPEFRESVQSSLTELGVSHRVKLIAGPSPNAVEQLALRRPHWELGFIDGNHEGDAPVRDAIAFANHAAEDALAIFHDAAAPAVGAALEELRRHGWNTAFYHTAQILGVAWRGRTKPVPHTPDSTVYWETPKHLQQFGVVTETG